MASSYERALKNMGKAIYDGLNCPCCGQLVKVYHRQINAGMVMSLMRMYKKHGLDWGYIPDLPARSREEGKLAKWGLCEASLEKREDGGSDGWWRVMPRGEAFLKGRLRVPKYALIYNNELIDFEDKEMVNAQDCLKKKFDLAELMGRPWYRI